MAVEMYSKGSSIAARLELVIMYERLLRLHLMHCGGRQILGVQITTCASPSFLTKAGGCISIWFMRSNGFWMRRGWAVYEFMRK